MAKQEPVKKELIKKKKKVWISLMAPRLFNHTELGETLAANAEETIGRKISMGLGVIIKQPRRNVVSVVFIVDSAKEGRGYCSVSSFMLSNAHIKRVVRKGKTRIDESFSLTTKDGVGMRVKPLMITANIVSGGIESKMRKDVKSFLTEYIGDLTYEGVLEAYLSQDMQNKSKEILRKIYPLSFFDIKELKKVEKKTREN